MNYPYMLSYRVIFKLHSDKEIYHTIHQMA